MSEANVDGSPLSAVVAQELRGIDTNTVAVHNAIVRASLALLTPEQLAEVVMSRMFIERAKILLMQIYDIDADNAFELLRWWSQATNVKLGVLARRLAEELAAFDYDEPDMVRLACDTLLFTAHTALDPQLPVV